MRGFGSLTNSPETQVLWYFLLSFKKYVGHDIQQEIDKLKEWANSSPIKQSIERDSLQSHVELVIPYLVRILKSNNSISDNNDEQGVWQFLLTVKGYVNPNSQRQIDDFKTHLERTQQSHDNGHEVVNLEKKLQFLDDNRALLLKSNSLHELRTNAQKAYRNAVYSGGKIEEFEWALAFAQNLLKLSQNDPIGCRVAGESLVRLSRFIEAIPIGERLIEIHPLNPDGYFIRVIASKETKGDNGRKRSAQWKRPVPRVSRNVSAICPTHVSRGVATIN